MIFEENIRIPRTRGRVPKASERSKSGASGLARKHGPDLGNAREESRGKAEAPRTDGPAGLAGGWPLSAALEASGPFLNLKVVPSGIFSPLRLFYGAKHTSYVMPSKFGTAEHWLERAREAREMAAKMRDGEAKQAMLEIAEGYEKVAKRAEAREAGVRISRRNLNNP